MHAIRNILNSLITWLFLCIPALLLAQEDQNERILRMQIYTQASYDAASTSSDAIRIEFTNDGFNGIDDRDAPKINNIDENLARLHGGTFLTIENREQPTDGEILNLYIGQFSNSAYVFKFQNDNFDDKILKLKDNYLNDQIVIDENNATYAFTINPSINASTFYGRFQLLFEDEPLSTIGFNKPEFSISPNPVKQDSFIIQSACFANQEVSILIYNQVGKLILKKRVQLSNSGKYQLKDFNFNAGFYFVKLKTNSQEITKKLIKT
ncbi:T9SS type A sorting domain-containing protein [Psychroflexus salis]|uniref:Secretion system C-terminal sorting domain-containing protein n=1 Tax=Psychroflexus salis TaxID=1526574 RepID=A0A916ZTJ1_9FLAO|nr:T9SS type A sorting domain-containing protein [Psychroflexus salis]GGE11872.1 hypothetical protein GCM10010831_11650 [Psychroflexus salis]